MDISIGFRPLDGESISKPVQYLDTEYGFYSFRPLDGESISKQGEIYQGDDGYW